ncbi:acetyl-CoA carboxylase biotin carboxyl carrier protein subunit [Roseomonas sp. NAR14]|uniref:Biotin carboxyl carrier protein of acetyl-CoA carboxylase n=1 Tax=Roseomonas acroporae TaxID=2937791 RepID=A0A9X1YDG2_9PROT|nr:biotin/lipoyl-containing protein [Roseomonas acroporae]MCK8787777.1 acetyl-CoA carboxylase biotin carboxyl carrier protein subunit [Roseomonas acroporae]
MDIDEIKRLIALVSEAPIAELEYREGETSLRIVKRSAAQPGAAPPPEPAVPAPVTVTTAATTDAGTDAGTDAATPAGADGAAAPRLCTAPLPGVFYRRAGPEEPAFVEAGATVTAGQTLGLIEAMKMLTPVKAPADGTILRILAGNGDMVEEGTPLFEIGGGRADGR